MNDKSLIVVKENFFSRIINFFRRRFSKKQKIEINVNEEKIDNTSTQLQNYGMEEIEINDSGIWDDELDDIEENEYNKEDFFKLYEDIKNGNEQVENVNIKNLLRINIMLKQELLIKEKKVEEYNQLEKELDYLQEENRRLTLEIKNAM